MWRQVCFVQTHILIKTNHRSIWYPSQSSFFSLILFIRIFWIPFFELNSAAITCLYVTDSDASLVFHIQSRIKSKEFKWVISPNMYRNEYIYICLHRHTQISMNFFSWVGGGLRCYMWGCIKKNILVGPCAVFQSWFSVCSMCLSASISNYNWGSGLWRDNRFSKIMRLLTHLIVATGRQLGLIFEQ